MPNSNSSPRTSLRTLEPEESNCIQLYSGNAQNEEPSVFRRLSGATSALFLSKSGALNEETNAREPELARSQSRSAVPQDGLVYDDYFGANYIQRSLTAKTKEDVESMNIPESDEPTAESSAKKKYGFWDAEFLSQRTTIVLTLLQNYIYLLTGFICCLCIYWAAYFNRNSRYRNLKFAVMVGDMEVNSLNPVMGDFVSRFFQNPAIKKLGNFDIWDYARLSSTAKSHNNTLEQEVLRQVHHQKYLAAFFVHENATAQMYQALISRNQSFDPSSDLLSVFYETGSDYNAMTNYVSTIILNICQSFLKAVRSGPLASFWIRVLGQEEVSQILTDAPSLLTNLPSFLIKDKLPVVDQIVQAPLQVGIIYLCIFTFFQFLFTVPIHMYVASKIKGGKYVLFRIATAQGSYLVLSLSYVVLNTAFGMDYRRAFGNAGFLVIWSISFLTMSSIGTLIEIMVFVCIVIKPAMIGVCLLLVAVLNLAPTLSPIYLCPNFYRYAYAIPAYNSYHLLQVAYFDSWKGNMGRHFGVLIAWSVVTNALLPFVMKWMSNKLLEKKSAKAAAAKSPNTAAPVESAHIPKEPMVSPADEAKLSGAQDMQNQSSSA